jgi:hypothetical protein
MSVHLLVELCHVPSWIFHLKDASALEHMSSFPGKHLSLFEIRFSFVDVKESHYTRAPHAQNLQAGASGQPSAEQRAEPVSLGMVIGLTVLQANESLLA